MRENLTLLHANNKVAYQPVHLRSLISVFVIHYLKSLVVKHALNTVWEINMGVCPRLDFDNVMLFNCLGYNFNIYGAFEFLCNSIANL